jgi:RNA polymerase sigma factor (sigma-70 family)
MTQDGFVKVYTKISGFKGESSLETWMTRIFINTCLSYLNRAENRNIYLDINDPTVQYQTEKINDDDATGKNNPQKFGV